MGCDFKKYYLLLLYIILVVIKTDRDHLDVSVLELVCLDLFGENRLENHSEVFDRGVKGIKAACSLEVPTAGWNLEEDPIFVTLNPAELLLLAPLDKEVE